MNEPSITSAAYRECARGAHCTGATRNPDTGEVTGALSPRSFCDACTAQLRDHIRDLPTVYRELQAQYGIQPTVAADDVRVHVSRVDPSIPVREDLDALLTETETVVFAYEDRVRQVLSVGPAPLASWGRRVARVEAACSLLAAHMSVLLSLPMEWMAIGGAHDERGGVDAGLDLEDVYRRAYRAAGARAARWVVPVVCPGCRLPAGVVREAGVDGAVCMCGYWMGEDEYRVLTGELVRAVQAA